MRSDYQGLPHGEDDRDLEATNRGASGTRSSTPAATVGDAGHHIEQPSSPTPVNRPWQVGAFLLMGMQLVTVILVLWRLQGGGVTAGPPPLHGNTAATISLENARAAVASNITKETYRQAFKHYDRDGSGAIDAKELREALGDLSGAPPGVPAPSRQFVDSLVTRLDKDGSGDLDEEEFAAVVAMFSKEPTVEPTVSPEPKPMAGDSKSGTLSKDGGGNRSENSTANSTSSGNRSKNSTAMSTANSTANSTASEGGSGKSNDGQGEVDKLKDGFKIVDDDGSGSISLEEFMDFMHTQKPFYKLSSSRGKMILRKFDRQEDGHLDFEEWVAFVKAFDDIAKWKGQSVAKGKCSPKLEPHQGLLKMYTSPGDEMKLLLDLTGLIHSSRKGTGEVVVAAMYARGTYQDAGEEIRTTTLHTPVEQTQDTLLRFRLSTDNRSVEVSQPQLALRTSDEQMRAALKMGAWSGWIGSLKRHNCSKVLKSCGVTCDENSIIVDGTAFITQGFFVAGWRGKVKDYRLTRVRAFPKNVDVTVELIVSDKQLPDDPSPDQDDPLSAASLLTSKEVALAVTFSLLALPEEPMAPRRSDDRLGFFSTEYLDLGQHHRQLDEAPHEAFDTDVRIIQRYNLDALPHGRIKMYVDPTVPERWRETFREGIEAWNSAFSLLGREAKIQAVLPSDNDWPKDYDAGDARYSTISWSINVFELFSLGVSKVDPRSGEILKTDIIMTSGWAKAWLDLLDHRTPIIEHSGGSDARGGGGHRMEHRPGGEEGDGGARRLLDSVNAFSGIQLTAAQRHIVLKQGLKSVVMHEVGHTLGLRHNFKGSMGVSWECTRNASCTKEHGLSSSVMDYLPMNIPASWSAPWSEQEEPTFFFTPVIGAYDKLAIRYGYMPVEERQFGEVPGRPQELVSLLRQAEAIPVCTDSDKDAKQDPTCIAFDLTSFPLQWYESRLQLLASSQQNMLASLQEGESYARYGMDASSVLKTAEAIGSNLILWIGGTHITRAHRGEIAAAVARDTHTPTHTRAQATTARIPISRSLQRRALKTLLGILRAYDTQLVPSANDLPYLVQRSNDGDGVLEINLLGVVHEMQQRLMSELLALPRLKRLLNGAKLQAASPQAMGLSLPELLEDLAKSVWGPSGFLDLSKTRDWDLQALLVEHLKGFYVLQTEATKRMTGSPVPMELLAPVLHHLHQARRSLNRALGKKAAQPLNSLPKETQAMLHFLHHELAEVDSKVFGSSPKHEDDDEDEEHDGDKDDD